MAALVDDLDLVAVRVFLAVVELGSVSKAAARSAMSQPSATARLQKLERQLGVALLERGPSGSVATDAGHALTDACADVLAAATRLAARADAAHEPDDVLRIAATRSVIELALPQWLAAADLADVTIEVSELDTRQVAGAVRDGRVALGFCDGPLAPLGLRSTVVGRIELVAVVAPSHPLADRDRRRRRSVSGSDLASARLILRSRGSGTLDVIEAALGPFEFSATGDRIEVPSNAAARLAAVNGSGVAIVPLDLVAADLADRRLSRLECTDVDLDQPIRLAWKGTRPTSRAARRLHGFLA